MTLGHDIADGGPDSATKQGDARYRLAIDAMDEGFAVCELDRDEAGTAVDFRCVDANPAMLRLVGLERGELIGRPASEYMGAEHGGWVTAYAAMLERGAPQRFARGVEAFGRNWIWSAFPYGEPNCFAVLGRDITRRMADERIRAGAEASQSFLLALSDALRPLDDAAEVQAVAARMLGERLHAARCYYYEYDGEARHGDVRGDYARDGFDSIEGRYRFEQFPFADEVARGETLVMPDVRAAAAIGARERDAFAARGLTAYVAVALVKHGSFRGALVTTDSAARDWGPGEVALIEAVAERTWAAVERARAETMLRASEERQRVLIAELQHRTLNLMGVVTSITRMTARSSNDLADFLTRFDARLDALARAQRLLSRLDTGDRLAFDVLLRAELNALTDVDAVASRVVLKGPEGIALRSSTVQILAMGLHELATNALKYGALAQEGAGLTVTWRLEAGELLIDWRESGVTMGATPRGGGNGRALIERALPYQLRAATTFALEDDGAHCTIALPRDAVAASSEPRPAS